LGGDHLGAGLIAVVGLKQQLDFNTHATPKPHDASPQASGPCSRRPSWLWLRPPSPRPWMGATWAPSRTRCAAGGGGAGGAL